MIDISNTDLNDSNGSSAYKIRSRTVSNASASDNFIVIRK